ncbi:hypothetical protein BDV95DRAFT_180051 [Massariosphaeria phaeospora]|uniref:Uncharacterized protein n=1 Tax=Massariosphaeria phaeospora TaxID=100035 RepID=A0A7C8MEF1_9PLEO|nr:hypothetical protein BDV95DRAFT_180051 [Massariosphaeria phaeospora]
MSRRVKTNSANKKKSPGHLYTANVRGALYKKNKREEAHRKRIRERIKALSSAQPEYTKVRRLKRSARKVKERETAKSKVIMPWIKDPGYRYNAQCYPPRSLPGLPTELRQQILLHTVDMSVVSDEGQLQRWASNLSLVSPVVRYDMQYVRAVWKEEWEKRKRELARKGGKRTVKRGKARVEQRTWRVKRGEVVAKEGPAPRNRRASRCWYCLDRHGARESRCPLSVRDPVLWKAKTKETWRVKEKERGAVCSATKVVFGD